MKALTCSPKCSICGNQMYATGDVDASQIKLDDVTVCLHCGTLLVFNADMTVRPAIDDDIRRLEIDEQSWDLIKQLQQLVKLRKKKPKRLPHWRFDGFTKKRPADG